MSTTAGAEIDPYAYLEDGSDPATIAWTAEQNARTRAVLDALPMRSGLAKRFEAVLDIGTLGVPTMCGARAFFTARRGSAQQASLYVREAGSERVVLDPTAIDDSGLVTIDWWYPSPRGTYVAYGLSRSGDERSTLYVLDVGRGTRLSEQIPDTRYASVAWFADETGFFYTRYPPGGDYETRAYRHELGADWSDDVRIFGDGRRPEESISLALSADGRRLVATVSLGWARCDAYLADTEVLPIVFRPIVEGIDAIFDVVPTNDRLYVRTNDGAPYFRVFEIDPPALERTEWREIVPETSAVLDAFAVTRNALVLHYFENVRSVVRLRYPDRAMKDDRCAFGGHALGLVLR